jgi:flavin-dependent dehydrogenase
MGIYLSPSAKIKKVIRYSPSGFTSETISKDRPIFYMFERGELSGNSLEQQLLSQAQENNVEIIYNTTVNDADIIATGPRKIDIFGYGKIYEGNIENVIIFYNNNYAPKGYLCVLPSGNKFQIMSVTFDKNEFKLLPKRFLTAIKKDRVLKELTKNHEEIKKVVGVGNYFYPVGYKNGKYYVGEAGGFQDAARGFGLWYAILTGYLAAKSIIEKIDYNELWKEKLLKEIENGFERRKIFNTLTNKDFDKIIRELGEKIELKNYLKVRKI